MAARTPGYEDGPRNGNDSQIRSSINSGGQARGAHLATDGDGCLEDGDSDSDGDDEADSSNLKTKLRIENQAPKKRKKSKRKKKKKTALPVQTSPPRVLLDDLYPSGDFPQGEIQDYTRVRTAACVERFSSRLSTQDPTFFKNYRKAAEAHRTARKWVHEVAKPGVSLSFLAEGIEDSVRSILGHPGLETGDSLIAGMGFPTGLCINNQVAHYTPNPGQKETFLQPQDTLTVDFGVHINGWIVDSAFTLAFDPMHDMLLTAVKDATNAGIKASGLDVRICDVSAEIEDVMTSYEVTYNGKTAPVKPVGGLSAHNIEQWHIHGGKSIPFVRNDDQTKMEEGEVFAIETFGTTGSGRIRDDVGVYGYGLVEDKPLMADLPLVSAKKLHKVIRENFGTIVFCKRYLERLGVEKYLAGLNCLVSHGIVEQYEPLADIKGSYSAQFEHTLILRESHREVLSRGDDY